MHNTLLGFQRFDSDAVYSSNYLFSSASAFNQNTFGLCRIWHLADQLMVTARGASSWDGRKPGVVRAGLDRPHCSPGNLGRVPVHRRIPTISPNTPTTLPRYTHTSGRNRYPRGRNRSAAPMSTRPHDAKRHGSNHFGKPARRDISASSGTARTRDSKARQPSSGPVARRTRIVASQSVRVGTASIRGRRA
jgi:hypothetical protein